MLFQFGNISLPPLRPGLNYVIFNESIIKRSLSVKTFAVLELIYRPGNNKGRHNWLVKSCHIKYCNDVEDVIGPLQYVILLNKHLPWSVKDLCSNHRADIAVKMEVNRL